MTPAAAVVLAAGLSRRMGAPKALLGLEGEPLVARVVRIAALAGATPVVVVIGRAGASSPDRTGITDGPAPLAGEGLLDEQRARSALAGLDPALATRVRLVEGRPREDALASLRAGLAAVPAGAALLLWPVDCPFADVPTVQRLLDAVRSAPRSLAVPMVGRRRGHPTAFGAAVVPELLDPELENGARGVVERDPGRVVAVAVDDPRVCEDADTPEAAARLGLAR